MSASASACPDVRLDAEHHRARVWDLAWAGSFAGLAVVQGGLIAARWTPLGPFDHDAEAGLWVGAGESVIGAVAHLVMPLRIDPCGSLEAAAHHEKVAFYLDHLGGLVVSLGGMVLLGTVFGTWKQGLINFAEGYPVSLLSIYTMPRGVWHLVRSPNFTGVALSGTF
jgi:hypothetical protein